MKKIVKIIALVCALTLVVSTFAACGGKTNPDGKETDDTKAVNAYTATFDEVAALLKNAGVSTDDAKDMNALGGYWSDNEKGGTTADPVVASDTAKDFGGVYLIWFDINGDYVESWSSMKVNGGVMVYNGGMYTLQMDSSKGMFALGFGNDVSEDVKNKAKTAFDSMDGAMPDDIKYMTSVTDLAMKLKEKNLVSAADIGAMKDLNETYYVEGPGEEWDESAGDYVPVENYQYFARFGTEAKTVGGVTIFYYALYDEYTFGEDALEQTAEGLAYKSLKDENKVVGYVGNKDYVYTPYTENEEQISYTVDLKCGSFAVSIEDSVANKAEIMEYLNSLMK